MYDKIKAVAYSPVFWGIVAGAITLSAVLTHAITPAQATGYAVATGAALKVALGLQAHGASILDAANVAANAAGKVTK